MTRRSSFPALGATLLAGSIGFLLNRHGLDVFNGTQIRLGGALPLAVAWGFGPAWGATAAALAFAAPLGSTPHPWPLAFAVAEALFTGWQVRRRDRSGLVAVLCFWSVGAPMAALLYGSGHLLAFPANWALAVTLPANALLSAVLANWLLAALPPDRLARWGLPPPHAAPSLARVLFRRFAGFAVLPMAAIALLAGRAFDQQVRRRTAAEIRVAAEDIAARLDAFLREHERAVASLADQIAAPAKPEAAEVLDLPLFRLRRRYPAFLSAVIVDATGTIIAASPDRGPDDRPIARSGVSIADRDFFQRPAATHRSFVSGAFRSPQSGEGLVVAASAPLLHNGRVAGAIVASVSLDRLTATLVELAAVAERDLVVVDSNERVVLSRGLEDLHRLDPFAESALHAAADAAAGPVFQHWVPRTERQRPEAILTGSAQAGLNGWIVFVQEPVWRSMRVVAGFYLGTLLMCAAAATGVLWFARSTVATITGPLEHLSSATQALASGNASTPPLPHDAPREIVRLAGDVSAAAGQLADRNRQLTTTVTERDRLNAQLNTLLRELDEKVQQRTAALAASNEELQARILAQHTAQAALAESDRRYRTVLDHLSEVVFQTDATGHWTLLSPAWTRLTGFTVEEAQGRAICDFIHPDDHDDCQGQFRDLIEGGKPDCIRRLRLCQKEGGTRWVQISARLTHDATHRPTGAAGTLSDIAELVEHEEALRLSRRRFDLAVRGSGAGLWDWDLDTGVFYFSPRAKELIGYADAEFPNHGREWVKVLHPEDQPRVLRSLRRSIAGRNPVFEMEFRLQHRDGSWRWAYGRGAALRDEQGRTLRIAGSLSEITDRKRAQAALEERSAELVVANAQLARAARLKDEFLASMSHELRTPLNAVLGMAEVLQEGIPAPLVGGQRDCVQTIAESGRHLLALINDILDLSKIEAGKIVIDREPVSIRQIVQASLRFIRESALKKNLQVGEAFLQSAEALEADSRRLKQILINLLSNAVKFTPAGGRVGIEVTELPEREAVAFTVWDTGIGIAPSDLCQLFQPFVQADSKLSRQYGGTGLGLAIVRKLATLHEGGVAVESLPGQGSRFSAILPLASSVSRPCEAPAAPVRSLRVLLIEENDREIASLRPFLEAHGCTLTVAINGPEGIALARQAPVDAVVLGLQLAGMEGFEVLRSLMHHPATAAFPVVAVTDLRLPGDRERCLAAGAAAFLEKPFRLHTLLAILQRLPPPITAPPDAPTAAATAFP